MSETASSNIERRGIFYFTPQDGPKDKLSDAEYNAWIKSKGVTPKGEMRPEDAKAEVRAALAALVDSEDSSTVN